MSFDNTVRSLIYREHTLNYSNFELVVDIKEKKPNKHLIKTTIPKDKKPKDAYRAIINFFNELHWFNDVEISGIHSGCHGENIMSFWYEANQNDYLVRPFEQKVFDEKQHLALAFYREGRSLNSPYYRLLCYYKVLEIPFGKKALRKWIEDELGNLESCMSKTLSRKSLEMIERESKSQKKKKSAYIRENFRNEIGHAENFGQNAIDFNDFELWGKVKWVNELLKELAKKIIIEKLKVKPSDYNKLD